MVYLVLKHARDEKLFEHGTFVGIYATPEAAADAQGVPLKQWAQARSVDGAWVLFNRDGIQPTIHGYEVQE